MEPRASQAEETSPPNLAAVRQTIARPSVQGKFIFVGEQKLYVRGVTYGAFRPDPSKQEYWDHEQIERDFSQMAANGVNTVRIPHTMPPRSLLDAALRHGLYVMVGLSPIGRIKGLCPDITLVYQTLGHTTQLNLFDGSMMSMLYRAAGSRWHVRLGPGEAKVFVIDKR